MKKIKTIFLDMDGVIVDFRKGCEELDAIEGTKVDWKIVHENGSKFWSELDWMKNGEQFYKWLSKYCKEQNIDLCILSAVGYQDGIDGKQEWLDNHVSIPRQNRYIVKLGKDKAKYASEDSLLIDDFGKNIEAFVMAGGRGIKFQNAKQARDEILGM